MAAHLRPRLRQVADIMVADHHQRRPPLLEEALQPQAPHPQDIATDRAGARERKRNGASENHSLEAPNQSKIESESKGTENE
jgi:hypothetical protein